MNHPNFFNSLATVVGYTLIPTQPLFPQTTIDSHSQQLHHPRAQLKKGLDLRMHIQLQLYEKACETVQKLWGDFINHGQMYPLKHPQHGPLY